MTIETEIFQASTPDFKRLKEYGFRQDKTVYSLKKTFKNGDFIAIIKISKDGKISGSVFDTENNEEFLPLKFKTSQGAFIGEIKEEYIKILTDIKKNCFIQNYFDSRQANEITEKIFKKFGDKPAFMWKEFPKFGVFKNQKSEKWYGIIMNIPRTKLGEESEEKVDIINIKLDREKIQTLIGTPAFYQAWHMNKKTWITITLDDTIKDEEIMYLIEESHAFTVEKQGTNRTK